jgi:ATP-dependent Lhr-like helicase
VARRYGIAEAPVEDALRRLSDSGRVLEGEFRPGAAGREWCEASVLTTLRRRSLALLRRQVEPAEPAALARLLVDWQGIHTLARQARDGPDALLDVIEQLQGVVVPASTLETDILPARLPRYHPSDLDALCAAGEVVWVGMGPLGERDGRLALYLAEDLPLLHARRGKRSPGDLHARLLELLGRQGASFFAEIHAALGGLERTLLDALWDLVWTGEVTNDTMGALRAFLAAASKDSRARRISAFRSRRQSPPSGAGRWSLLAEGSPGAPTPTARATALAQQLLARHGVVTRDAVLGEEVPGGFVGIYPVLKALEDAGRVRRGYFVAGMGGSQFADPGALERLRALRETAAEGPDAEPPGAVLAAVDPANPYGATLPWPSAAAGRLQRVAGTYVVLVDGALAAYVGREGREVPSFLPDDEPARSRMGRLTSAALAAWVRRSGRSALGLGSADVPLAEGALAPFLAETGFVRYGPGFRLQADPAAGARPAPPARGQGS